MATNGDPPPVDKKQGTRVYKKSSPNGKITTYLGKRDFYDHLTHCDPIDGVVLVDPEYLQDRKVFVHVLAAFRYGREDLDVLGLTFRKDLFLASVQVYPPLEENKKPLTRLQERLIKKLGNQAYPFLFQVPKNAPASVTLQPAPGDTGQPCGVDYELKTYVADSVDDKPQKRNSVRLAIRKLTYAPAEPAPQPSAEASKEYMMSHGALRLEATLDKEKYYHGESIAVNVCVDNNSNKTVKKIKVTAVQASEIVLFSKATYKCQVDESYEDSLPIQPSQTGFCKVYVLTPLLMHNRNKQGLALDGKLKHEDTNLASSTIFNASSKPDKENLGIIVQYRVKVRLSMRFTAGDLSVELPFTLTHPEPTPEPAPLVLQPRPSPTNTTSEPGEEQHEPAVDTNLIQLDTNTDGYYANQDDDLIFEDFARLRLKGHEGDEVDA